MEKEVKNHSFSYDNGTITATGITNVKEFGEREIVASLSSSSLVIRGASLKITELNVDTGILRISGELYSLQYGNGSVSFLKRLLK